MEMIIPLLGFLVIQMLIFLGVNKVSNYRVEKLIQAEEKKQDKKDTEKELFIGQKQTIKTSDNDNNIVGKIFIGLLFLLGLYLALSYGGSGMCSGGVTSYDC